MRKARQTDTKIMYTVAFALYVACYFVSAYNRFQIFGIEYVALAALWFVGFLDILARRGGVLDHSMNYFYQCTNIIKMTCILGAISLAFQVFHLQFKTGLVKQLIFLAFPAITTMLICNTKEYAIEDYFNMVLIGALVFFFTYFSKILTWQTILRLNFLDSYSPFEIGTTSIADIFFFCTLYFGYKKKFIRMGIAAAFGILSFKRLMVVAIIVCVLLSVFGTPKIKIRKKKQTKKVSLRWIWATIFVIPCIPLVMQSLVTDAWSKRLSELIGMDINDFVKGRFELMTFIIESQPENFGLGTITEYISKAAGGISRAANVHNDLFRLMYETTIVGLVTLVYYLVKNTRRDLKTFAFTVFFLCNLAITNSLTNFMPMLLFNLLCCEFLTGGKDTQQQMTKAA